MRNIHRRLARLESRRPAAVQSGRMIAYAELDPALAAMFLALGGDVGRMTLDQVLRWEAEIMRFAD